MDSDIEVGHRIHDLKIDSSPNTILSKNSVEKVNKQEFENRPQKQKQSPTLLLGYRIGQTFQAGEH